MGSLGETLRQARLDRGASLLDAEQETRIRRKYLEALETEDYSVLPAPVYARGFVRSYARYLGLDPESTLDLFAPGRVRDDRPVLKSATPQLQSSRPVSNRVITITAGAITGVMLLAYLWTQYNSFVESLGEADRSAGSPVAATAAPTRPTAVAAPPSPTPAVAAPAPAPEPAPPPAPLVIPTPDRGVIVEARITDRTWLEVWVDGVSQLQTTLQTGASRSFSANQSVRMRVGNAAAVQITVNGQAQGALGDRNQVKDFVWER